MVCASRHVGIGAALALAGACALLPRPAAAQNLGWALDRFEPTPAGNVFFANEFPTYAGSAPAQLRVGLVGDYSLNSLEGPDPTGPRGSHSPIIADYGVVHLQLAGAFYSRLALEASIPFVLMQSGDPYVIAGLAPHGGPVVGDIRLGARVRVAGHSDRSPISLHIGESVYLGFLGTQVREDNASDAALRARLFAVLAGRIGPVRWSLTGGYHARPTYQPHDLLIGSEAYATAAIALVAAHDRLTIGPEAWASTTVQRAFQRGETDLELLLGLHYLIADTWLIGAGAGTGIIRGAGTPLFRALVQLAYAPGPTVAPSRVVAPPPPETPADRDHDGVPDARDPCPDDAPGANPDPARPGCPVRDTDLDGVPDPDDLCPNEAGDVHPDPARRGCPASDTDHDGVYDNVDQCPTVPQGAHPDADRPGCPDGDSDQDGVLNHDDPCPAVPQGAHPDPERPGCPLPDRDGDGIPDASDHCPDQPGAPSTDVHRNGCPGLVTVAHGMVVILSPVFFAQQSDRILHRSTPVLTAVADALRATPSLRRVSIEGHTDNAGDDAANMALSERRAQSVMAWLIAHGVEATRLEAHGRGETQPLQSNHTRAGRDANRRVEFHIVDPAPASAAP